MSNIDKITEEMENEVKRSKGGVFWRLLLVWMKEVNKQSKCFDSVNKVADFWKNHGFTRFF